MTLINRYAFLPFDAWLNHGAERFPNAVNVSGAKVVNYDSSKDSVEMLDLVKSSGLELVHYSKVNADMIIRAIDSGIDKIYNCNHDVALAVTQHFNNKEVVL